MLLAVAAAAAALGVTGPPCVAQAGLELSDLMLSVLSGGLMGGRCHTWLITLISFSLTI